MTSKYANHSILTSLQQCKGILALSLLTWLASTLTAFRHLPPTAAIAINTVAPVSISSNLIRAVKRKTSFLYSYGAPDTQIIG